MDFFFNSELKKDSILFSQTKKKVFRGKVDRRKTIYKSAKPVKVQVVVGAMSYVAVVTVGMGQTKRRQWMNLSRLAGM